MLAVQNIFGLGQDATATPAPVTLPGTSATPVTMPAVPDNTVVRCKFDPSIKGLRCTPVGAFEPPTLFLLAAGAIALLGIGYAFGRVRFLPRAVESFTADPHLPTRRRR